MLPLLLVNDDAFVTPGGDRLAAFPRQEDAAAVIAPLPVGGDLVEQLLPAPEADVVLLLFWR